MSSERVALDRVDRDRQRGRGAAERARRAERPHRRPAASPGPAAAAGGRHPPAGARAPGPQEIQVQRAGRLGHPGAGRDAERGAARRRQAQQHRVRADAARARAAGHRLCDLPRGDAPRDHVVHAAPARRVPRIYVSPREVEQALERDANQAGINTEYDVSHILLSLPESATTDEMSKVEAVHETSNAERSRARISASSRSPIRKRSPRWSAASWAGDAWASCRNSSATW